MVSVLQWKRFAEFQYLSDMVKRTSKICNCLLVSRINKKTCLFNSFMTEFSITKKGMDYFLYDRYLRHEWISEKGVICYQPFCCCWQVKYILNFEWKHNKPKANNGLMLCCKLWVILAHSYNAFIEYSVLHKIFFTSLSVIQKGKCSNGNKAC